MGYLITHKDMTMRMAWDLVTSARPLVRPNDRFFFFFQIKMFDFR